MTSLLSFLVVAWAVGQSAPKVDAGQFLLNEDIGLALNKSRIFAAAQEAWSASFGSEPGAQITLVDPENGLLEGKARMNYRSKMLMGREETMGVVSYHVSILVKNGQCQVRVHDLRHTGNRAATGGGINAGLIMEGPAPSEHYPGVGLNVSRRMHADIREAAAARLRENLRKFAARLRLIDSE